MHRETLGNGWNFPVSMPYRVSHVMSSLQRGKTRFIWIPRKFLPATCGLRHTYPVKKKFEKAQMLRRECVMTPLISHSREGIPAPAV